MNKTLAEQTSLLLLQVSAKLDAQLRMLKTQCADEEFQVYLRGFGYVLGYMFTEIMTPIYAEHPDLKPEQLGLEVRMLCEDRGHDLGKHVAQDVAKSAKVDLKLLVRALGLEHPKLRIELRAHLQQQKACLFGEGLVHRSCLTCR